MCALVVEPDHAPDEVGQREDCGMTWTSGGVGDERRELHCPASSDQKGTGEGET